MRKREIVKLALNSQTPPYVPWNFTFTQEAGELLKEHYQTDDLNTVLDNHLLLLGNVNGFFTPVADDRVVDYFGVTWDRSRDKDIGIVEGRILHEPNLRNYNFPDPVASLFFDNIPGKIEKYNNCFRCFCIGFSLYERAWTLRGMEHLMMDFYENTDFARQLLNTIADYNIAQLNKACEYDIDAVYFGDDWGQQHGLQMGPLIWKEFIYPPLKRMYSAVRNKGKYVIIHSCGDVDELFDDLIDIGLNCFNPFQPEVMDIESLMCRYHGRLSFYGGLSTQRILPYGSVEDVKKESLRLLELGRRGNIESFPCLGCCQIFKGSGHTHRTGCGNAETQVPKKFSSR